MHESGTNLQMVKCLNDRGSRLCNFLPLRLYNFDLIPTNVLSSVDETSIIKETEVQEPIADLTAIDDQPTDEAPIKESSIGQVEEKRVPTVEKDGDSGSVDDGRNENQSADPEDDDDEVCDDDDDDGGGDDDGGDDGDDGDDDDDDGDEVVDPMDAVKEKCGASPDCKSWAKKLESCNERLEEGISGVGMRGE